jgi:hypothetical protein
MLTTQGTKLLDFGMAKRPAVPLVTRAGNGTATADSSLTGRGSIVGTVQYTRPTHPRVST